MKKVIGSSRFGYVWHFDDEERGDIYFSLAHQGEPCSSVARRYGVSSSVIRRLFRQMIGEPTSSSGSAENPGQRPRYEELLREAERSSPSLGSGNSKEVRSNA